jgi:hypothetical protein
VTSPVTTDSIPDEVYTAVGQVVVWAAMFEAALLELCAAVKIDRNVGSPAVLLARRKWAFTPGTKLIDLMLESLDRVPERDRDVLEEDLIDAQDALRERHVAAHTAWPFGMTEAGMLGVRATTTDRVMDAVIKTVDDFRNDAKRLREAEQSVVGWLRHFGAWN